MSDRPTASRFSSASRLFSASSRAFLVDSTRFSEVLTCRPTSRTDATHLRLQILQPRRLLVALQLALRDRRVRHAAPERIRDVQLHAPGPELVAEHVAQGLAEGAIRLIDTKGTPVIGSSANCRCVPAVPTRSYAAVTSTPGSRWLR